MAAHCNLGAGVAGRKMVGGDSSAHWVIQAGEDVPEVSVCYLQATKKISKLRTTLPVPLRGYIKVSKQFHLFMSTKERKKKKERESFGTVPLLQHFSSAKA